MILILIFNPLSLAILLLIIFLVQAEGEVAALNRRIQLLEEVNIDSLNLAENNLKRHSTNYHQHSA